MATNDTRPRTMNKRHLAALVAVVSVVGLTSVVAVSQGQSDDRRPVPVAPSDPVPAAAPSVTARTAAPDGGQLGVATYRNKVGQRCAAFGRVKGQSLVDRRDTPIPFELAGNCTMRPDPVAIQVGAQGDDPTTRADDRSVIVWGIAADSVGTIEVSVGGTRRNLTPGRDGAFVMSIPPEKGNIVLNVSGSGGTSQTITLPPAPDLSELNRQFRSGEIPTHRDGGP